MNNYRKDYLAIENHIQAARLARSAALGSAIASLIVAFGAAISQAANAAAAAAQRQVAALRSARGHGVPAAHR